MTARDTIRYNVARLVRAYAAKREIEESDAVLLIAVAAWPPGPRDSRLEAYKDREVRRRKLLRYMRGDVTPPDLALEQLARVFKVRLSAFRRPPPN